MDPIKTLETTTPIIEGHKGAGVDLYSSASLYQCWAKNTACKLDIPNKLSLVTPTYNEASNITNLTDRLRSTLAFTNYELIIVDDNSPDGTGQIADNLAQTYENIHVVHRVGKMGLASAVIEGFNAATGDVLGVIDADLQHPPEKVHNLYYGMGTADIVIASRYIKDGGVQGWSRTREIISRGAKILPQLLFSRVRNVADPLSGFFLFKRSVIEDVELQPIGYKILLEILVRGHYRDVLEIPYVFVERKHGQSNFNTTEQINYLKHLWRLMR
jgi:dolichol-phosphate mannosyltransferase